MQLERRVLDHPSQDWLNSHLQLRQIHTSDFQKFDYIFCMDRDNLYDVQRLHGSKTGKAKIMLFGEFAGKKRAEEVQDPYYVCD